MSKDQEFYAKMLTLSPSATQQVTVPVAGLATLTVNGTLTGSLNLYVYIDGILTTFGWSYDSSTHVITFNPARVAGEEVIVTNKTI